MKKFQIFIHGKNFPMLHDGGKTIMDFYTTRWVEATSPEEAEVAAIDLIKNDQELKQAVIREEENPPMLYAEKIIEIEDFEGVSPPGAGYTFYPQEE